MQDEHMSDDLTTQAVHCSCCGKRVSQYVNVQGEPAPLIVRAWVECPECVEKRNCEPGYREICLRWSHRLLVHYSRLLNMYDEGQRVVPEALDDWVDQCQPHR